MDASQLSQDLRFVRQAVNLRDAHNPRPSPIFFFWGLYVLIGFPLVDFAPRASSWFFLFGTLVGIIFSGITARRLFARSGVVDRSVQIRGGIHWTSGILVATAIPIILANLGAVSGNAAGQLSCILVGTVYLTAGIHIDRPFFWMGLLLIAGGTCLGLVPGYGWTILGILLAASLFLTGARGTNARPMGAGFICQNTAADPAAPARAEEAPN